MKAAPPLVALLAACAPTAPRQNQIDLKAVADGRALQGVSVENGNIQVLVENRGITTIDRDGRVLDELRVGERGLVDRAYRDASSTGRETFILMADNEGYLYDPLTETQNVHFCLVPEAIIGPIVTQKNDAVDVEGDTIVAAPRFYELDESTGEERLTSSEIRTYRLSTGEPISSVPMNDPMEVGGIAVDGDTILAVEGGRALRFTLDGERLDGELTLEGVGAASGIAVDALADEVLVLDGLREQLVIFSRGELR